MEGLLLAHDRIATTTDRSPATVLTAINPSSVTDGTSNKTQNQNANFVNNNVIKVKIKNETSLKIKYKLIFFLTATRTISHSYGQHCATR